MTKEEVEAALAKVIFSGAISVDVASRLSELALKGLERDAQAEKIGKAVLEALAKSLGSLGSTESTKHLYAARLHELADELFDVTPGFCPSMVLRAVATSLEEA